MERMRFGTSQFADGQQPISFVVESEAAEMGGWLVDFLDSEIRSGTRFLDKQTIGVGWSLLQLQQADSGLELYEPDFDAMPIRWCRGVSNTLRHLQLQRGVCEVFGCEPDFATLLQAGVKSPAFCESDTFTMSRDDPAESDSGWVFSAPEQHGNAGEFCSLYELALRRMEIVPFLALPPSSEVTISRAAREVIVGGVNKSSRDCEFLRDLVTAHVLV